ncbi:GTP pyrophosphokinase [Clostridium cylindrosporum]|uniref:RelA/SpoT domain-containing protein n=1 Tax=Clostridium cylindrosporum DSM 605 TaxID=1121307 RepID=A0A0J8DAT7_CLOCY|nr:hypothetical protein [Clostridium cylindrosporum]KMT23160.1 RelA/SpoT domain-containing protein [Clostridium cylindrosporum DSM 605]
MRLKIFNYVDEVIEILDDLGSELQEASLDLENYFENLLIDEDKGFINSVSRVKSATSLREKILRNEYYKRYEKPCEVIENLSDLIGVRIECRFIEDEKSIHKFLRKKLKLNDSNGYFYSSDNENVKLQLKTIQPEEQKNGFKIYRIDGKYTYRNKIFNFELQIKSIVNMFWGDIEHKIIYKNYNYILNDNFFKEIMGSIKNNLTMIDNQLLVIDNYFNGENTSDIDTRREQIESLLAKILYDVFSTKMKNSLGFIVDFRKASYIIIKYITMKNSVLEADDYTEVLLKILTRINEVGKTDISFNSEIIFDREIVFEDRFSKIFGNKLLKSINSELQWNLFFRMLFAIESKSNEEDFENFVEFIRNMYFNSYGFKKLDEKFKSASKYIKNDLMKKIASCFDKIDTIDFLYEDNILRINECIEEICDLIIKNIDGYLSFVKYEDIYYGLLEFSILSVFGNSVKVQDAMKFIEVVKNKSEKIKVSKDVLKFIDTLENLEEIRADEILALFKM